MNPRDATDTDAAPENPPAGLKSAVERDAVEAAWALREGAFQRSLALLAGGASLMSGLEVAYEHYRGSYSRRVMYTPVILSGLLAAAGVAGCANRTAARTVMPGIAALTLVDSAAGFYFHVRGIARKPGGWRLPVTNLVMGPPVFAPLLFGIAAYLALLASFLRRENAGDAERAAGSDPSSDAQTEREAHFGRQLAVACAIASSLSGAEAWYSHLKNNFRYRVQWTPVVLAPLLTLTALAAVPSARIARTVLPAASALAIADGAIGFGFHMRGVLRRPGGTRTLIYNIIYGPPVFAPLLFAASGFLGVLAALLRKAP